MNTASTTRYFYFFSTPCLDWEYISCVFLLTHVAQKIRSHFNPWNCLHRLRHAGASAALHTHKRDAKCCFTLQVYFFQPYVRKMAFSISIYLQCLQATCQSSVDFSHLSFVIISEWGGQCAVIRLLEAIYVRKLPLYAASYFTIRFREK